MSTWLSSCKPSGIFSFCAFPASASVAYLGQNYLVGSAFACHNLLLQKALFAKAAIGNDIIVYTTLQRKAHSCPAASWYEKV